MSEPIGSFTKCFSALSAQHRSDDLRTWFLGVSVSANNWLAGGVDCCGVGVGVRSQHCVVLGAEHVEQSTVSTQRA